MQLVCPATGCKPVAGLISTATFLLSSAHNEIMYRKLPGRQGVAARETPSAPTLKAGDALLASPSWQQSLVEQVQPLWLLLAAHASWLQTCSVVPVSPG